MMRLLAYFISAIAILVGLLVSTLAGVRWLLQQQLISSADIPQILGRSASDIPVLLVAGSTLLVATTLLCLLATIIAGVIAFRRRRIILADKLLFGALAVQAASWGLLGHTL